MKILAINTAFQTANIVLENDGKIIERTIDSDAKSSEKVLPCVEEMLEMEGLTVKDIDRVGVVVGTGSFTGIRIAIALVKGFMCVFEHIKTVAINSLDLMAYEFVQNNKNIDEFYCVQNALSSRFFVAKYNKNLNVLDKHALINELPKGYYVGLENDNFDFVNENISFTTKNLLNYTKQLIEKEQFVSVENLSPVYLRLSQAEENLLKKENIN